MIQRLKHKPNGFTLVELIAVIVIIGILSLVVTSSYKNWNEDSKKKAALMEMKHIADAEKIAETHYGYYLPLTVLDDLPSRPSGVSNGDVISDHDYFRIVDPKLGTNLPPDQLRTIRDMLAGHPTTSADTIQVSKWKGPFLEYQNEKKINTGSQEGMPLDPWYGSYHFKSITGDEIGPEGDIPDGVYSNTSGRWAIMSYGKDALPNTNDDLYYTFN